MTRKDYIRIAAIFAETRPILPARSTANQRVLYEQWHEIRGRMMEVLRADNPRFDRARFVAATEKED